MAWGGLNPFLATLWCVHPATEMHIDLPRGAALLIEDDSVSGSMKKSGFLYRA